MENTGTNLMKDNFEEYAQYKPKVTSQIQIPLKKLVEPTKEQKVAAKSFLKLDSQATRRQNAIKQILKLNG